MSPLPSAAALVPAIVGMTYITAAVCFVLSLVSMEQEPALRRGQLFGALSMLLVSSATYWLCRAPETARSVPAVLLAALLGLPLALAILMSNGLEQDPAPIATLLSASAALTSVVTFVMLDHTHLANWVSQFSLVTAAGAAALRLMVWASPARGQAAPGAAET